MINNKYVLDVCGRFFLECIRKITLFPHKFPTNKSKFVKQYFTAKNMNSSHALSKKLLKKCTQIMLDALKNTCVCKINYSKI